MLRSAVNEPNPARVLGWASEPGAEPDVVVVVDGEPVGRARLTETAIVAVRAIALAL